MKKLILVVLLFPFSAFATDHHVISNITLSAASGVVQPGDVVYIGNDVTYTIGIKPLNSGTSENPITYRPEEGEDVTIDTSGSIDCIELNNVEWIRIEQANDGSKIKCLDPGGAGLDGDNADHNIIDGVDFSHSVDYADGSYGIAQWDISSSDNVIKNCTFYKPAGTTGHDLYLDMGDRNLFKNNNLSYTTHVGIEIRPDSTGAVVIGNVSSNPIHTAFDTKGNYTLVQDNIFKNAGADCDASPTGCSANGWSDVSDNPAYAHQGLESITTSYGGNRDNGELVRWNLVYSDNYHGMVGLGTWLGQISHARYYHNTFSDFATVFKLEGGYDINDFRAFNNIFAYGNNTTCYAKSLLYAPFSGTALIENNLFYSGTMRYKTTNDTLSGIEAAHPTEVKNNLWADPSFENRGSADYRLSVGSSAIDYGMAHTTTTNEGTSAVLPIADPYVGFSTGSPRNYVEPVLSEISSDIIYNATQGWTAIITGINYLASTWTLNEPKTFEIGDLIFILHKGEMYTGSAPDFGYVEYGIGTPPTEIARYETLETNCNDSNPDESENIYNLSDIGSVDRSSTTGITVDDNDEGYCRGTIFDSQQISIIAKIKIPVFDAGPYGHTVVSRMDIPNGRNFATVIGKTDHKAYLGLGYNNGDSWSWVNHETALTANTYYWICWTIDGINKLANIWIRTTGGSEVGSDIDNTAILSGQTWNYNESQLLLGVYETSGVSYDGYHLDGLLDYAEIRNGIISETDFENIVTGASSSSPKATSNCFSNTSGTCLTADQDLTMPGEWFCHAVTFDEVIVADEGPTTVENQVTLSIAASGQTINLPYYSGYGTTKYVFCDQTEKGQKYGEMQIASTDPINLGTITSLKDTEGNAVDKDGDTGLDNALSNVYNLKVETKPHTSQTDNAQPIEQTGSAQPVN